MEKPKIPFSQLVFGESVYWLCVITAIVCMIGPIIAMLSMDGNVMNPHYLFASIFKGNTANAVWEEVAGEFPGGHFWLDNIATGDGFTQLGLVIGCGSALPALMATAMVYLFKKKERSYIWVLFSLGIAALISISILGIVNI